MSNFLKIAEGVDVIPLLLEIERQPELWGKNPARMSKTAPHYETEDIILRSRDERNNFSDIEEWKKFSDKHIPVWYRSVDYLPSSKPIIYDLLRRTSGEMLGGVFIYKVAPGKQIYPHSDSGWHAEFFDKFNVCLQSNPEAYFYYPDTEEVMYQKQGDVHLFKNKDVHTIVNNGTSDHIILTICIRNDRGDRCPWSPEGWSLDKQIQQEFGDTKICQQVG